jgi:hypothetical protein
MPRISAESRAGAIFRAGGKPPAAPRDLDATAARLWRAIAADRPVDWWTPASLRLLRRLCRTSVYAERLHDALDAAPIGSELAGALFKQVLAANASIGVMAAKLRLTVQNQIDRRSGQITERGVSNDPLLGGRAVVQLRGMR